MAKDYFQDILPPDEGKRRGVQHRTSSAPHTQKPVHEHEEEVESADDESLEETTIPIRATHETSSERSIRNISVPQRARPRPEAPIAPPRRRTGGTRWLLWTIAAICVLALGVLAFVAMRSTVITITPRAKAVTFDGSTQYTAYPTTTAASGTLAYSVSTIDLDDSQVVPTSGTVHAEDKASGTVTVYNAYQTSPLKLVKNTRFQAAGGQIFRAPADIVVPGKSGSTPGQVTITVVADQAGDQYNVPAGRFTVPGLQNSGAMFTQVYAQSTQPMTGGFVGDKPGVDAATLQSAVSQVRDRLESKARDSASQAGSDVVALPDLMQITYTDDPQTTEAGGGVRIHETAHIQIPVFPSASFVQNVAGTDPTGARIVFQPQSGFAALLVSASSTLGSDPITFTLKGPGQLVWGVDTAALTAALAGKPQTSFQSIVSQFAGVEDAKARIEPFWKSVFPADSSAIKVNLTAPSER